MSGTSDEQLRRLFAHAPGVPDDEHFVATVAADVATRRATLRLRRGGLRVLLFLGGVALAFLLAPFAPSMDAVPDMGSSLLDLPGQLGNAARTLPGGAYLGFAFAAVALPLAGVAWLSRRS